jgi:hypothetical protein
MAAFNTTGRHTHPGVTEGNMILVEHVVTAALAATDTLDIKLDTGVKLDANPNLVPFVAQVVGPASAGVRTIKPIAITSVEVTAKGYARVTVGAGGYAIGDVVAILFVALSAAAPVNNAAPYLTAAGAA